MRGLLLVTLVATSSAACGCQGGNTHAVLDAPPVATPSDAAPVQVDAASPPDAAQPDAAQPDAMPPARVILVPNGRPEAPVNVAIARTPAERARGLMYVQNLPVDDGMIFIFQADENLQFWMKNTLIYLDMIFIDKNWKVVGVVANAEPMTLTPRGVGALSRYVLEVNGGWAAAHGVTTGTTVRYQGFTP